MDVQSTNIHLAVDLHKAEAAEFYLLVLSIATADAFSVDAEAVVAKVQAPNAATTVRTRIAAPYRAVAAKKAELADANLQDIPTTPTCKRPLTSTSGRPPSSRRRAMASRHSCFAPPLKSRRQTRWY